MTYIDYVNQFWKTHQSVAFSSNEVYLYFFLLNESKKVYYSLSQVRKMRNRPFIT